jgi:hypothetical protein
LQNATLFGIALEEMMAGTFTPGTVAVEASVTVPEKRLPVLWAKLPQHSGGSGAAVDSTYAPLEL